MKMNDKKYYIEKLIETFENHSQKFDIQQKELIKKYRENYPDTPLPEHFCYDFSISKALKSMCEEIQKLRENSTK
jgi:hypothetical protein